MIEQEKYIIFRCTESGAEYIRKKKILGVNTYYPTSGGKIISYEIGLNNFVADKYCFNSLEDAINCIADRLKENFKANENE